MKIRHLVLHCSDSAWGDAAEIDRWHQARGFAWAGGYIGYHYVVGNGRTKPSGYQPIADGHIWDGRPETVPGAHVQGLNADSLGVCMFGRVVGDFTGAELHAASHLMAALVVAHGLAVEDVLGHCETASGMAQGKTCPVYPIETFRGLVSAALGGIDESVQGVRGYYVQRYAAGAVVPTWRGQS